MNGLDEEYVAELAAWKADRLARLTAPDGWLNLTDRVLLGPGTSRLGSAPDNDVVLSIGPAHIGTLTDDGTGSIIFAPEDGIAPIVLKLDAKYPPRFSVENLLLEVTLTNDDKAVRVRDTASPRRSEFPGLEYFPPDPAWRIVAEWVAFAAPLTMTIDTTKAISSEAFATHRAIFAYAGQRHELIATHGTAERPQFVLRDLTSKDETYPAARFLIGEPQGADAIVLDFNKAYNPPCAFTEHAVCPLPPPQNVLPFAVTAGELRLK